MPERFRILLGRTTVIAADDVDTDQIIPARFLTTTSRRGLGARLFADVRAPGQIAAALDRPDARARRILVAGSNFGCGSSREHAPWALRDFGFRAVIGRSFADIFRRNALQCGLLPITVDPDEHAALASTPGTAVVIDLDRRTLRRAGGRAVAFEVESFARTCLLAGTDALGWLRGQEPAIAAFEELRG